MAIMKYLLSDGRTTYKVEEYMIDLFKLYLTIFPGDIPGAPEYGFNFDLVGVYQQDLPRELKSRISELVRKVNSRFTSGISLSVSSLEIIDETRARLVVEAGQVSSEIVLNIY
jgi:hypothetical protein